MKGRFKQLVASVLVATAIVTLPVVADAKQFTVTPGVEYIEDRTGWNNQRQIINQLQVDVAREELTVDAFTPEPFLTKKTLMKQLTERTKDGHHVVGGINAAFFHVSTGAPAYLLAENNQVHTYGVISSGRDEYMNIASAFAVDKNGKGLVGKFGYAATVKNKNGEFTINSVNKAREAGETIMYTPSYSYDSTRSNVYGKEFVLTNIRTLDGKPASIEKDYPLGTPVKATVSTILEYGGRDSKIPKDGVVISVQGGEQAAQYGDVSVGDEFELTIDMQDAWKNADFILASGPLLVQDGQVQLEIRKGSSRENSRHPRSAVAVNADGSKIWLVTVDGRATASKGMTLSEFATYLKSIGAHAAINLDGGGSTTMGVRSRGDVYAKLVNRPSDGYERAISTILGAVSKTTVGPAQSLAVSISGPTHLLPGGTTKIHVQSALDKNFHVVPVRQQDVKYEVTNNLGTMKADGTFTATTAGKGTITATYGNTTESIPIEVLAAPSKITILGASGTVSPNQRIQLTAKAYDAAGNELAYSSSYPQWRLLTSDLGTISSTGLLTTNGAGKGRVQVQMGEATASIELSILAGAQVVHSFESANNWEAASSRADTTLRFDGISAPYKDGKNAMTMSYDFTNYIEGTSASYANAKVPITLATVPSYLGIWAFGNGGDHWLRGVIQDATGKQHTVDFTENGQFNWKGWRYTKAQLPTGLTAPLQFKQLYVVEVSPTNKKKGSIYFDRLVAEYGETHQEPLFTDVENDFWAQKQIAEAVEKGWINGYGDGTFKGAGHLSRAHAAVLLTRALHLELTGPASFPDVASSNVYSKEIAAVVRKGLMNGKPSGHFDPEGKLTRAQMAKILTQAYDLPRGTKPVPQLKDVDASFWAYEQINQLLANEVTIVSDFYYRPNDYVTRTQFAVFLSRAHNK